MAYPSVVQRLNGLIAAAAAILLLGGCAGVNVKDYQHQQPRFTLKQFFNGPIMATGVFRERSGKVARRFHARLEGKWQGDNGTLSEHFDYVGDHPDASRVWQLTQQDMHHFTGTGQGSAGDIVGTAQGEGYGYTLHWSYDVDLPTGDTTHEVHFDDWMWMVDPNTVIDHSTVTKFGITVGSLNMVMQKIDPNTGKVMQPMSMAGKQALQRNSEMQSENGNKQGNMHKNGEQGSKNTDDEQTFGFQ